MIVRLTHLVKNYDVQVNVSNGSCCTKFVKLHFSHLCSLGHTGHSYPFYTIYACCYVPWYKSVVQLSIGLQHLILQGGPVSQQSLHKVREAPLLSPFSVLWNWPRLTFYTTYVHCYVPWYKLVIQLTVGRYTQPWACGSRQCITHRHSPCCIANTYTDVLHSLVLIIRITHYTCISPCC